MAWAFVAHKDGMLGGVISSEVPTRDLKKFTGDYVARGFAITPAKDREEYLSIISAMPTFHPPERKTRKSK